MRALVVGAGKETLESVSLSLQMRWPDVVVVSSCGSDAMDMVERESPDIVVWDIDMPEMNALDGLTDLRSFSDVPVIALIGGDTVLDRYRVLELGADDFVSKPLSLVEFMFRVHALFRRTSPHLAKINSVYSSGRFLINFSTREVAFGEDRLKLSPIEYRLLYCLVRNERRIVTKDTLIQKVWGSEYLGIGREEELRKYVYRLRSKLKNLPDVIVSEPGIGYRFMPLD
ncbi:MAG TPA: response regulator transcription factor [Dehalococcoidales bacterium]|nr:response regulator transcription factor [Dehalococcoidales bacterium]